MSRAFASLIMVPRGGDISPFSISVKSSTFNPVLWEMSSRLNPFFSLICLTFSPTFRIISFSEGEEPALSARYSSSSFAEKRLRSSKKSAYLSVSGPVFFLSCFSPLIGSKGRYFLISSLLPDVNDTKVLMTRTVYLRGSNLKEVSPLRTPGT